MLEEDSAAIALEAICRDADVDDELRLVLDAEIVGSVRGRLRLHVVGSRLAQGSRCVNYPLVVCAPDGERSAEGVCGDKSATSNKRRGSKCTTAN